MNESVFEKAGENYGISSQSGAVRLTEGGIVVAFCIKLGVTWNAW